MKRIIVRFRNGNHTNLIITEIIREEALVFAYNGEELVGMFDLGAVEALYVSGGNK